MPNQYRIHMTSSHKIQAKLSHGLTVILCSIGCIDAPNKGIEQACSRVSCDIVISPFGIIYTLTFSNVLLFRALNFMLHIQLL